MVCSVQLELLKEQVLNLPFPKKFRLDLPKYPAEAAID